MCRAFVGVMKQCFFTQQRIDGALEGMDSKVINERRREDLHKFLTTTNTKAAVFRDIIIESGNTEDDTNCK